MADEKKAVTESKKKKLSCCGKSYNAVHPELGQYIFVEDDFLIKKTVQWIQTHIEDYHVIGEHAKKALQNLQNTDAQTSGQAAALKHCRTFFHFTSTIHLPLRTVLRWMMKSIFSVNCSIAIF